MKLIHHGCFRFPSMSTNRRVSLGRPCWYQWPLTLSYTALMVHLYNVLAIILSKMKTININVIPDCISARVLIGQIQRKWGEEEILLTLRLNVNCSCINNTLTLVEAAKQSSFSAYFASDFLRSQSPLGGEGGDDKRGEKYEYDAGLDSKLVKG